MNNNYRKHFVNQEEENKGHSFLKTTLSRGTKLAMTSILILSLLGLSNSQTTDPSSNVYTNNDGVSFEKYVSYLRMDGSKGATIALESQKNNQKLDYTVMVWFKPQSDSWRSRYQYALSFQNSLECYFTASAQLSCQSDQMIDKLTVDVSTIQQNQWAHISLSGTPKNGSYLMLEQNLAGQIAYDNKSYLALQQNQPDFTFCLGSCYSDYAFIGGFRELVILNQYISSLQASRLRNHYLLWDNSILAYYRFTDKSILKDEFKRTQIAPQQGFTFGRDYIPNDICFPILDYRQFFQFSVSSTQHLQTMTVDGRWSPQDANWGYSVSLRIKINQNSCTQASPTLAQQGCFFVFLNQAFMLFQPAPNQVAAYFFGGKIYMEYQTRSVFVPDDQWVNIQFTASQYYGYELMVYDILGRLMNSATEARTLQGQDVKTKQLTILKGTQAVIKDLKIFTSKKTLPMELPVNDTEPDFNTATDCLAHFTFSSNSMVQVNTTVKFINYCKGTKYGAMDATIAQPFTLTPAYWKQAAYNSSSKDGLITSPITLFDGIACSDQNLYPKTLTDKSYIKSTVQKINNNIPNATIEFWFKVDSTQTQYLAVLWAKNKSIEFFSVMYDGSKLICAPFALTSVRSPTVTYADYTEANRKSKGWFHLACAYEQQKEVVGYFYSTGIEAAQTTSITNVTTVLVNDTYEIYLGNNKSQEQGTVGVSIREFRFWGVKRSLQDIKDWRKRSIDPRNFASTTLFGYLRLSDGGFNDDNFVYMINPTLTDYSVTFNSITYSSDSSLSICPINTYISSDGKCYQNPVQYLMGAVYPDYDKTSNTLNWLFSSNETIVLNPDFASQMQVSWMFEDTILQIITQQNNLKSQQNMKLSASSFRDQNFYKMRLNYSNADLTYLQVYPMTFVPNSCQFYLLSSNNKYSDYLNYTDPQSLKDLTFNFTLVQRKTYCSEVSFFNKLDSAITYQTSPPLLQKPAFTYTVNNDSSISVTFPKAEQYKLPILKDVKFVFKLQWVNSQLTQLTDASSTFQNLQYTIRMNYIGQALVPSLVSNTTDVLKGEALYINATGTSITFSTTDDYSRLTYKWICPAIFATFCAAQNKSEFQITQTDFTTAKGEFNVSYTFSVNASYVQLNNLGTVSAQSSIIVKWQNIDSTSNTIISPGRVTTTAATQTFNLFLSSYDATKLPANIVPTWSIVPNITKATYSQNNTVLTVASGGFVQQTTYTMRVVVQNTSSPTLSNRASTLTFSTLQPPSGGQVNINPTSGFVNVTNFTVQIVNWQSSNKPIRFRVWSTTSSAGTTAKALLTTDWVLDSQTFKFIAADTFPYIVEITDSSLEVASMKISPNVTVQAAPAANTTNTSATTNTTTANTTNTTNTTSNATVKTAQLLNILALQQSPSAKYQQLGSFAQNDLSMGSSGQEELSFEDSIAVTQLKAQIIDNIGSDVSSLSTQSSEDSKSIAKGSLQVLSILLQEPESLSTESVQKSLDIVQQIQTQDPATYKQLKKDSSFKNNLAQIASGVMRFTKKIFGFGRVMQQDEITQINEQVRQLKDNLLQELCEDAVPNSVQQQILTQSFDLLVQKFTMDTVFSSSSFYASQDNGLSGLDFQIKAIANQLSQLTTPVQDDSFCVQTTFFNVNPQLQNNNILTQYSSSIFEYRITDESGLQQYQVSQYNPSQTVGMNFALNPSTFKTNQTECMAYSSSYSDWSDNPCLTEIDEVKGSIKCQCNMIDTQYYGVFTDASRIEGEPIDIPDEEQNNQEEKEEYPSNDMIPYIPKTQEAYTEDSSLEVDHSFAFISVVLVLLLLAIITPSLAIYLDKRDYKLAKESSKNIDKQSLSRVMRITKLSDKPYAYWVMRQDDIINYTIQSKQLISHYFEKLHPFISIFSKHDMIEARIWRFAVYFFQLSVFSIICVLAFGPNYRSSDSARSSNESSLDQVDITSILLLSIFGVIFLLPLPFQQKLISNKLILPNPRKNRYLPEQANTITQENQQISQQNNNVTQHNNNSNEVMKGGFDIVDVNKNQNASQSIEIQRRCQLLKYLLILVSYLLSLTAIVLCFIYSTKMPVANQYCLVASFYTGFFGSLIITNVLRICINAFLISRKSSPTLVNWLFISSEAKEIQQERNIVRQALNEIQQQEAQSFSMKNNTTSMKHNSTNSNQVNTTKKQFKKDFASAKGSSIKYSAYDSVIESKLNRSKTDTIEDLPGGFQTMNDQYNSGSSPPDSSQRLDDINPVLTQVVKSKQQPSSPVSNILENLKNTGQKLRSPSHEQNKMSSISKYSQLSDKLPHINDTAAAMDSIDMEEESQQE